MNRTKKLMDFLNINSHFRPSLRPTRCASASAFRDYEFLHLRPTLAELSDHITTLATYDMQGEGGRMGREEQGEQKRTSKTEETPNFNYINGGFRYPL